MSRRNPILRQGGIATAALVVALVAARADAQTLESVKNGAEAYDAGVKLHAQGQLAAAAAFFARADLFAPNDVALTEALNEALRADAPALGMALVERGRTRSPDAKLSKLLATAAAKFGPRAGKLTVSCPGECVVTIDGDRSLAIVTGPWVSAGRHEVGFVRGAEHGSREVDVPAGATVPIAFEPAPPPPPPPAPTTTASAPPASPPPPAAEPRKASAAGVSPTWFWVGVGVTGALTIGTVLSGVDARSKHADFTSARSDGDLAKAGESAQTRTNVLVAVTAVAAAATGALGLFVVHWGNRGAALSVVPTPSGGALTARGTF